MDWPISQKNAATKGIAQAHAQNVMLNCKTCKGN